MIHVNVRERDAVAQATEPITVGSVGLQVRFRFSEDWEGLTRTAVFRGSGASLDAALLTDSCTVPHEVLVRAGLMCRAETCVILIQDWLGLGHEARINDPALLPGNWHWRLKGEYLTEELPQLQLVSKMIGKELEELSNLGDSEEEKIMQPEVFYEAEGLSSTEALPFDFSIRKGEVNGFTGLLGSGRSESVRAIFGADKVTGGTVKINGKPVKIQRPIDAMKHGIGYLAEDRKRDGIIAELSVRENIILALQVMNGMWRPISRSESESFADEYIKVLNIKTASRETPVGSLSGGNQQKVILARWLLTHPDYLILDEPTRGIDVGTKLEIQKLVLKLAEEGVSVTFISSEVEEMLRTCSRLIVMRDRHAVGELTGKDLNQTQVMKTIAGGES